MGREYHVTAADYLERAESWLAEGDPAALFYAALELRCGVEARLLEYLEVQNHLARKQRKGWRVAALGAIAASAFKIGDKVARFTLHDQTSGEVLATFYYTPVTGALRKNAEKLGNFLHAARRYRPRTDEWWTRFRALLEQTASLLRRATKGTLLGVPLRTPSGQLVMRTVGKKPSWLHPGTRVVLRVEYLSEYPGDLEAT